MGFGVIDPHKVKKNGYVEANDYALPYLSSHFEENSLKDDNLNMLQHVNCSYLSTPGRPPTLEALKKHAQSLTVLISQFAPSSGPGEINNARSQDPQARRFNRDEAFDWLNDLQTPYSNADRAHHRPLNSLTNRVKSNSDIDGVQYHCPLEEHPILPQQPKSESAKLFKKERQFRLHARHTNLLMHANECLEMLDHEFSATGGLLSILPTQQGLEAKQLESVKDTLVGQWLVFTQQLICRMHELEIAYANSLDLLKGEAVVPMQHLSIHGPDGRSGRTIVFPQDRWILANAGDDVLQFLHQSLDKKEISAGDIEKQQKAMGVIGETLIGSTATARGIVHLDLNTRFYRIKGDQRGPIYVLPAYADRPGTAYTREMESRPTIVAIPTPKFPERVSEWERKSQGMEQQLQSLKDEVNKLRRQNDSVHKENGQLEAEADSLRRVLDRYKKTFDTPEGKAAQKDIDHWKRRLDELGNQLHVEQGLAGILQTQIDALTPNEYSWKNVAGELPRDVDGNITNKAMKGMLETMKKVSHENNSLRQRLARLETACRKT
ncbi:uncharacterized protein BCR38DRAFT_432183 [Pseudomassariella vexata]|uniref:Uncharacterized protein n=1 Tax=Pseudomassariella vexata TaxID=1141098 RepID=A0A1Y2E1K9_9PEZI|nr:uncharacterized protein BCR38DRAFT_432183 [Pseudomassariella vexata]ORY65234.1 hypothetical protein BCR38DRAFT_432183 [Pseudomassariella vexata]